MTQVSLPRSSVYVRKASRFLVRPRHRSLPVATVVLSRQVGACSRDHVASDSGRTFPELGCAMSYAQVTVTVRAEGRGVSARLLWRGAQ
jgi:hypothetical protein